MSDDPAIDDIRLAIAALEKAVEGLRSGTPEGLDHFAWGLGFARGRLVRASERLYRQENPKPISDWLEAKG